MKSYLERFLPKIFEIFRKRLPEKGCIEENGLREVKKTVAGTRIEWLFVKPGVGGTAIVVGNATLGGSNEGDHGKDQEEEDPESLGIEIAFVMPRQGFDFLAESFDK